MADIRATTIASSTQWVRWLTIRFIPNTPEIAATGRVIAAMTASRSAAIVIRVSVRAR